MPVIKFTTADILRQKLIDEGWYGAKVTEIVGPIVSKAGDSYNYTVRCTLDEKSPAPGKVIEEIFNTKAIGRMVYLVAAARDVAVSELTKSPFDIDTEEILGKDIDVHVIRDSYLGQWTNKADNYLPKGKGNQAPPF